MIIAGRSLPECVATGTGHGQSCRSFVLCTTMPVFSRCGNHPTQGHDLPRARPRDGLDWNLGITYFLPLRKLGLGHCAAASIRALGVIGPVAGGQQKVSVLSAAKCLVLRTMALHDSQEKSRGHCPLSCHYYSQPCQPSRRCSNRIHCSEQG